MQPEGKYVAPLSRTVCESFVFVVSSHAVSDRSEHLDERTDRRLSCWREPEGSKIFADTCIFAERGAALLLKILSLIYFLICSSCFHVLGGSMTKSGKPIMEQQFA